MPDAALFEHGHIRRTAADIGHHDAYLFFVLGQDCFAAGQRFQHQIFDFYPETANCFNEILNGGYGSCNDMCFYIKTETVHAYRVFYALLAVHGVSSRYNMQQPSIAGGFNTLRRGKDTFKVVRTDDTVVTRNRNYAVVIHRGHMPARNADIGRFHLVVAGLFSPSD